MFSVELPDEFGKPIEWPWPTDAGYAEAFARGRAAALAEAESVCRARAQQYRPNANPLDEDGDDPESGYRLDEAEACADAIRALVEPEQAERSTVSPMRVLLTRVSEMDLHDGMCESKFVPGEPCNCGVDEFQAQVAVALQADL